MEPVFAMPAYTSMVRHFDRLSAAQLTTALRSVEPGRQAGQLR